MIFKIIRQILFSAIFFLNFGNWSNCSVDLNNQHTIFDDFSKNNSNNNSWLKNWKNIIYSSYQIASEFFRYSFRATLFSPLMNACDFVFQKYEKFLSILLGHFIKHKPLISEEWVHITHPNTFLYFTTTDGQIFLSCHNQKLMKEKKKTIFFFSNLFSLFFSDFLHDCSLHLSLRSEGMPRFLPDCSHGMQSQVFKKFCLTLNTTVLHDSRFSLQI